LCSPCILPYLKAQGKETSFAFVGLAGLMTHTCSSCSNHQLCMLSPHSLTPYLPTPTHQTRSSQICICYYTRQCTTIYIGLCNCMLSSITTSNILQFNIRHTFIRALCVRHVIMESPPYFLHLVRCDVLMNISQKPLLPHQNSISVVWFTHCSHTLISVYQTTSSHIPYEESYRSHVSFSSSS